VKLDDRPGLVVGAERLPWGDGAFGVRMLAEHLDPTHDLATRRPAHVDAFVDLLDALLGRRSLVVDIGCGGGSTTWCADDHEIARAGLTIADRWGATDGDFQVVVARR
jgi:hypothetical protein